jgi:hypothetical protein
LSSSIVSSGGCRSDRGCIHRGGSWWALALLAQTDAAVAHGKDQFVAISSTRALHRQRDLAFLGELDRVRQQVQQHLPQPRHVAGHGHGHIGIDAGRKRQALLRSARTHQVQRRVHALTQHEGLRLELHAPGLDLREVEDVVDDRQQRLARFVDQRRQLALVGVEPGVEQQPAHADDAVHRRADLVAHRRQERALGLVGGLGCSAGLTLALRDAQLLESAQDDGADKDERNRRRAQARRPVAELERAGVDGDEVADYG